MNSLNKKFYSSMVNGKVVVANTDPNKANGGMSQINPSAIESISLHEKRDIYFVVNKGGIKQNEIKEISSIFIDVDAGRDNNSKYFKNSIVAKFKNKVLSKIKTIKLSPSWVVETRNGYQIYWQFKPIPANNINKQKFEILQNKLQTIFAEFGADNKVKKINQLLRVPGSYWNKQWEGYSQFLVNVNNALSSTTCYSFLDIIKAFNYVNVNTNPIKSKNYKPSYYRFINATPNPNADSFINKLPTYNQSNKISNEIDTTVINDVCDLLEAVNKQLYFAGQKFLAKQCLVMSSKLKEEILKI